MRTDKLLACGQDVVIYPTAIIPNPGRVRIGNNVIIDDGCFLYAGADDLIEIGDFVHIGYGTSLVGSVRMRDFSGLSAGVRVYGRNEDYSGFALTNPTVPEQFRHVSSAPVELEVHSIVGANSVLMPGAAVGMCSAVGALSYVGQRQRVTAFEIWAGCPARRIGERGFMTLRTMEAWVRELCYDGDVYVPKSIWKDRIAAACHEDENIKKALSTLASYAWFDRDGAV